MTRVVLSLGKLGREEPALPRVRDRTEHPTLQVSLTLEAGDWKDLREMVNEISDDSDKVLELAIETARQQRSKLMTIRWTISGSTQPRNQLVNQLPVAPRVLIWKIALDQETQIERIKRRLQHLLASAVSLARLLSDHGGTTTTR